MRFAAQVIAVCFFVVSTSTARAAETSLRMWSDPGDGIGQGQEYFHTTQDGTFTVNTSAFQGAEVYFSGSTNYWNLLFSGPSLTPLATGLYRDAQRYPFHEPPHPGLSISGNGRGCNTLTGDFRVKQVSYSSPGRVSSLWVLFEQHCGGALPALRGDLRINADAVVGVMAPFNIKVERAHTLTFEVSATDVAGRRVTLSAVGLPDGAAFVDHGDSRGTFSWTPGLTQTGPHDLTFMGDNGHGTTDTAPTTITVTGTTSLTFESEPGDPIGLGKIYGYTAADGRFIVPNTMGNSVSMLFDTPSGETWHLGFAAAGGAPLTVGAYTGAMRFPFQPPTVPGLSITGNHLGCNTLTGSFEVKQIEIVNTVVAKYWATFEQHCDGVPPALKGEIRLNADVPIVLRAPAEVSVLVGDEIVVDISAVDAADGPISLEAADLPDGATFTEHGDDTGTLRWAPAEAQLGPHTVRWTASNGQGDMDHLPTRINVRIANDEISGAVAIGSLPFQDLRDTTTATSATTDPSCGGRNASVWYVFTPPNDVSVVLDTTGTSYTTSVGVFRGPTDALQRVACSFPGAAFQALAGETYYVRVSSFSEGGALVFAARPTPPPPANDDFDQATMIPSMPFHDTVDAEGATVAADDPYGCGLRIRTLWYAVTPSQSGGIQVETTGSDYFPAITVYTGERGGLEGLTCGYGSVRFPVTAGATYYLMVDPLSASPPTHLALSVSAILPLEIHTPVGPFGSFDPKTRVAYVSGTATCSRPATLVIQGQASQGAVEGTFHTVVPCTGSRSWSAAVSANGFQAGAATVSIEAVAQDQVLGGSAEDETTGSTTLRPGRIRTIPSAEPLQVLP